MKNDFLQLAEKYLKKHSRHSLWLKAVGLLSCAVVFCTVYALILPAVTMEKEALCGLQEHCHSEICYTDHLICDLEGNSAHAHSESCYEEETTLICGMEASEGHLHSEGCFREEKALACTEDHEHEEDCFEKEAVLTCSLEEGDGFHAHSDSCIEAVSVLICEISEEIHVHEDDCFDQVLTCTQNEHTHGGDCFEEAPAEPEDGLPEEKEEQAGEAFPAEDEVPAEEEEMLPEENEELPEDETSDEDEETPAEEEKDLAEDGTQAEETEASEEEPEEEETPAEGEELPEGALAEEELPPELELPTEGGAAIGEEFTHTGLDFGELIFDEITVRATIYTDSSLNELSDDTAVIKLIGRLPIDCEVCAYPVEVEMDEQLYTAYDISILLPDGMTYEPEEGSPVSVIMIPEGYDQQAAEAMNYEIYYVPEEGEPERMDSVLTEKGVSFEAEHFSVYLMKVAPLALEDSMIVASAADLVAAIRAGGAKTITLGANITVAETLKLPANADITLDLNGKNLTADCSLLFDVGNAALTITDSALDEPEIVSASVKNDYDNLASYSGGSLTYYVTEVIVIDEDTGATRETVKAYQVSSGLIIGKGSESRAIQVSGGSVVIAGGVFCNFDSGTSALTGAGAVILAEDGAKVSIEGGVMAANRASNGGAVAVFGPNTELTMTGGILSGNSASGTKNNDGGNDAGNGGTGNGGAIYAAADALINVSGGYITNNHSDSTGYYGGGGGIALCGTTKDLGNKDNGTTLNLSGGYITGNYAKSGGGGIRTMTHWTTPSQEEEKGLRSSVFMKGGFVTANVCDVHEGGGISLQMGSTATLSGGYITNNQCNTPEDWGGGGVFNSGGSTMLVLNALITDNEADGFGGGVAGCSTGRLTLNVDDGVAIFGNTASGTHTSGDGSHKRDDLLYKDGEMKLTSSSYQDYFCALYSHMATEMLGGGNANWSGTIDGVNVVHVPASQKALEGQYVMALTADPSTSAQTAAMKKAKLYINGNYSNTHGGGILTNGKLLGGHTESVEYGDRLQLVAYKALKGKESLLNSLSKDDRTFTFNVTDESGAVVSIGTVDTKGEISFDRRLPFTKAGTYTYLVFENDSTNGSILKDTVVYRIKVTVNETEYFFNPPIKDQNNYIDHYTLNRITKVEVDYRRTDSDSWTMAYSDFYYLHDGNITHDADRDNSDVVDYIRFAEAQGSAAFTNEIAESVSISVKKQWTDGSENKDSVKVWLTRNGERKEDKSLSSYNGWSYTWNDLPTSENGTFYNYSVEEETVSGYVTSYTVSYTGAGAYTTLQRAESLNSEDTYLIAGKDGSHVLAVSSAHRDAVLTGDDAATASIADGKLAEAVPSGAALKLESYNGKSILRVSGKGLVWLGCESNASIKTTSNGRADCNQYAAEVRMENGKLQIRQGHVSSNSSEWHYLVYQDGKFTVSSSSNNAVVLYRITGSGSSGSADKLVTVTNTPIEQVEFRLNLTKYGHKELDGQNVTLEGAEFMIYRADETGKKTGDPLTFIPSGKNVYTYAENGSGSTLVTGVQGTLAAEKLPGGRYVLVETQAPAGYGKVENQIFALNENTKDKVLSLSLTDPEETFTLPETGGSGTGMYTAGGLFLMLMAAMLLFYNHYGRRKEDASS